MTPPPARRRTPPAPHTPARSQLVITIAAPDDCYEAQTLALREAIEANPGDTEIRFHVSGKVLALPARVHVGPALLKGVKAAAGPSWSWEAVSVQPGRGGPPPARRPA